MNDVFVVEGQNAIGKSYFIRRQIEQNPKFKEQKEITEIISSLSLLPKFSLNELDIEKSDEWFLQKEYQRYDCAINSRNLLSNRLLFSTLSYIYARHRKYGVGNLWRVKKSIEENLGKTFIFPQTIALYSSNNYIQRIKKRSGGEKTASCLEAPYDEEFYKYINEYYKNQSKIHGFMLVDVDFPNSLEDKNFLKDKFSPYSPIIINTEVLL